MLESDPDLRFTAGRRRRALRAAAGLAASLTAAAALAGCVRSTVSGGDAAGATARAPTEIHPPLVAGPPADLALIYSGNVRGQVLTPGLAAPALGGLARRATLVDRARLQAREVFQVDTGDFLPVADDQAAFATPALLERRARLVLTAYERMDVDVVTLGPRELQVEPTRLRQWIRDAKLPVVLANVILERTGQPFFPAQRVRWVGERKVGTFGISEPSEEVATALRRQKLAVTDAVAAAQAAVAAARAEGAALVIGLFNLTGGAARAQQIAAAVPGIDVVVYAGPGPSPAPLASGPLLVAAGEDPTRVGRIDARVRAGDGGAPAWQFGDQRLALDATVPDQLGVSLLLRADTAVIRGLPMKEKPGKPGKPGKPEPFVYEPWTYGSTRSCAMCHPTQAAQWESTEHARSLATLRRKGRDRDPFCVGCHADAFLQPGGTLSLEVATKSFGDVGCEACHGPSVAHVRATDKKKGTSRRVDPLICLGCHTPDQSFGPFEYARALKAVMGPGHGQPAARGL